MRAELRIDGKSSTSAESGRHSRESRCRGVPGSVDEIAVELWLGFGHNFA